MRNKATNSAVWEDVILSDYPDYTYKFTRVLLTSLDTNLQQNVLQAVGVQDGDASPAQLHKPPVGKLVEHPGDHLAG